MVKGIITMPLEALRHRQLWDQHIKAFLVLGANKSPSSKSSSVALLAVRILVVILTLSSSSSPLPSSRRGCAWERPSRSSSSRLTEGVISRAGLVSVELLWQAALERLLEAWCLAQFSLGPLYSPAQVCQQEDYGLRSTLLGLNKPVKGESQANLLFQHSLLCLVTRWMNTAGLLGGTWLTEHLIFTTAN